MRTPSGFRAGGAKARRSLPPRREPSARDLQRLVFEEVPFIPVGAYYSKMAVRRELQDRVSGLALFYGLRRV